MSQATRIGERKEGKVKVRKAELGNTGKRTDSGVLKPSWAFVDRRQVCGESVLETRSAGAGAGPTTYAGIDLGALLF